MKKLLSVLLAMVLLLGLAAPAAFAMKATDDTGKTELSMRPIKMKVDDKVVLMLKSPDADPDTTYAWYLKDPAYIVSFRVVEWKDGVPDSEFVIVREDRPDDLHRTVGDQMVMIVGHEAGTNTVVVKEVEFVMAVDDAGDEYVEKVEYHDFDSIDIIVNKKDTDRPPFDQNWLWTILKIWWHDLQWTWLFEIHPALKFAYFFVTQWIADLWSQVMGWFGG